MGKRGRGFCSTLPIPPLVVPSSVYVNSPNQVDAATVLEVGVCELPET